MGDGIGGLSLGRFSLVARLGAHAAHAAMAGKTEVLISLVNNALVHLPMRMAVGKRNSVDPEGPLWRDVLEVTRQPMMMIDLE